MSIKSQIKNIIGTVKYVHNMNQGTKTINKQTKSNIGKIAIQGAQKNFTAKTGQVMTPSRLSMGMSVNNKESREYNSDKKKIKKEKMKKYGM